MVEMILEPDASVHQDLPGSYNGFLYILEGKGLFGAPKTKGEKGQVLFLTKGAEGEESFITVTAADKLRLLLYAGEPLHNGPFVMNTKEEIRQAIVDYQTGKFE